MHCVFLQKYKSKYDIAQLEIRNRVIKRLLTPRSIPKLVIDRYVFGRPYIFLFLVYMSRKPFAVTKLMI